MDQDNDSLIRKGKKPKAIKLTSHKETNAHLSSYQFLMKKVDKNNFLILKNTSRYKIYLIDFCTSNSRCFTTLLRHYTIKIHQDWQWSEYTFTAMVSTLLSSSAITRTRSLNKQSIPSSCLWIKNVEYWFCILLLILKFKATPTWMLFNGKLFQLFQ